VEGGIDVGGDFWSVNNFAEQEEREFQRKKEEKEEGL